MSSNFLILLGGGGLGGAEVQAVAQALLLKRMQKSVVLGIIRDPMLDSTIEVARLAASFNIEFEEFPFSVSSRCDIPSEIRRIQKQIRNRYSIATGLTQVPAILASLSRCDSTSGVWQQRDTGITRFFGPIDNFAALKADYLISNSFCGAEYVNRLTLGCENAQ
jgi:hypothetical protein